MTSLTQTSFRLKGLFLVALISFGFCAYQTSLDWFELLRQQNAVVASYEMEEFLKEISNQSYKDSHYDELKQARTQLEPPHRAEAMSDIVQAYAEKSPSLLKKRVDHFLKNEREFRSYIKNQTQHLTQGVRYYAVLGTLSLLGLFLFSIYYIQLSIFKPLRSLAKKMTDFLNNKYSYQFSVPEPNEVGHLQATFNAMAQQVLANMEELKTLDHAKTEFLSIASHELRTPLTSIKGSLSLLQSGVAGPMNDTTKNLITIAETETNRLIRLINDILDLAKIEAGRLPLQKEWSGLIPLFQNTLNGLSGLATSAGVELKIHPSTPHVEIEMDADRVQQVITNLLSNAIKFSPKGGRVEVKAELEPGGLVKIMVTDQGRGIAPDDIDRIFEKFSQASSPENPLVKGTGLGLAIARAIVDEHGGEIGVQSVVGKGSQFYFTLPNWRKSQIHLEHEDFTTGVAA